VEEYNVEKILYHVINAAIESQDFTRLASSVKRLGMEVSCHSEKEESGKEAWRRKEN